MDLKPKVNQLWSGVRLIVPCLLAAGVACASSPEGPALDREPDTSHSTVLAADDHGLAHVDSAYGDLTDRQLNEMLRRWGVLSSAERRELLVEIRSRMAQREPRTGGAAAPAPRMQRLHVRIRIGQSMRFGLRTGSPRGMRGREVNGNRVTALHPGRLVVAPGGVAHPAEVRLVAWQILDHMRGRIGRTQLLSGPGFGDGFEQRQAFLRGQRESR